MSKLDWILFIVTLTLVWAWMDHLRLRSYHESLRRQVADVDAELKALKDRLTAMQDVLSEIQEGAKEASMTPLQLQGHRENLAFKRKLPLMPQHFIDMAPGDRTHLWMREYTYPQGSPLIYDLEYRHRQIEQIPSDPKHPIAHGEGRLEGHEDWRPVRILFSPNGATCRGLSLEGEVKDWEPRLSR